MKYSHVAVDGFGINAVVRDLAAPGRRRRRCRSGRGARPGTRRTARRCPADAAAQREVAAALGGGAAGPAGGPVRHVRRPGAAAVLGARLRLAGAGTSPCGASPRGPGWRPGRCSSPRTASPRPGHRPDTASCRCSSATGSGPASPRRSCSLPQSGHLRDRRDGDLDDRRKRAWRAATSAYKHGYFDPADHRAMLDRLAAERGEPIDISCFVNDRRGPAAAARGAADGRAGPRRAAAHHRCAGTGPCRPTTAPSTCRSRRRRPRRSTWRSGPTRTALRRRRSRRAPAASSRAAVDAGAQPRRVKLHDPVGLPRLPAVGGELLLPRADSGVIRDQM